MTDMMLYRMLQNAISRYEDAIEVFPAWMESFP